MMSAPGVGGGRGVGGSAVLRMLPEAARVVDGDDRRQRKVCGDQVDGALVVRQDGGAHGRRESMLLDHGTSTPQRVDTSVLWRPLRECPLLLRRPGGGPLATGHF